MSLPLTCPLLGTWPRALACALTGNRTETRVCRPVRAQSTELHQPGLKVWHFAFMILFNSFPCEVDMMVFIFLIRKKLRLFSFLYEKDCFPFSYEKNLRLASLKVTACMWSAQLQSPCLCLCTVDEPRTKGRGSRAGGGLGLGFNSERTYSKTAMAFIYL